MDNSFILLSSMSPKIHKTNRSIVQQKVPTKLALKRNIRRSSIFDNLPPTVKNNSLILVEDSTTDTLNSSSSYSGLNSINTTSIIISDSDSTCSEECNHLKTTADINNKLNQIPNDCGLSESKFNAIDKWVSNCEKENREPSLFSNDLHQVVPKVHITKRDYNFDDFINSIKRTLTLQESDNTNKSLEQNQEVDKQLSTIKDNQKPNDFIAKNNLITNENDKAGVNASTSNMVISTIKADDSLNSSSDVIEVSDDNVKLDSTILDELYGDNWKKTESILLPRSEPRNRKKKTNILKVIPKTEVKLKPKLSIIHKNPYLDSERKQLMTPSTQSKTLLPWSKRLQRLCDSDSSDQSFNEIPQKNFHYSGVRLFFNDTTSSKKDSYDNKMIPLPKNVDVALKKMNTYLLEEKKLNKIAQNISTSSVDSEKENFSDFSVDNEPLEDRIRRKLTFVEKTELPVSRENKLKKTKDDLKSVFNKKYDDFKSRNIFPSQVCHEADVDNNKLLKKTKILKKKTTAKTRELKKKPVKSSSESSDSNGILHKANGGKNVASNDSENICKSFLASLSGSVSISQCDPSARIFRNSFKIYRSELVTKLFNLYNEKIFENTIPENSLIEWSERMRGTAGYCYCKKITRRTGLIERTVRIVLASKVLDCADRVRDTLIHEMCHAATWIVNEVADGHGSYWKAWAHKAKQTFPELPPIKVCHNYAITTKYTYKCTKCAYSFGRHSKSIDIERKRCGHCYGTFEILINKTTKDGETRSVPVTPKKEPTGFALFVKENYVTYKSPQLTHGQVMKLLGQKFGELRVSICKEDKKNKDLFI